MTPLRQSLSLLLLSAAAGCVDAVSFLSSTVFPANMTGNSVILALSIVRSDMPAVGLSALVLAGFVSGAFLCALRLAHTEKGVWDRALLQVLSGAALLLVGVAVTAGLTGSSYLPWLLLAASIAMGMQGTAVLKLGVSGVATTVVTGAMTFGIAHLAERWKLGKATTPSAVAALPLGSWLAYGLGALLGGFFGTKSVWIAICAPGLLMVLVVFLQVRGNGVDKANERR